MSQKVSMYTHWGGEMSVDISPDAFLRLKLNIRKGDKLLPLHEGGKVGPLVSVIGVGFDSGRPTGKTVIWCETEGKKQKGEPVFFFPHQFPELFKTA